MITQPNTWTSLPNLLKQYRLQRAVQTALDRAYAVFAQRHPEWVAALFDEHFLVHRVAPLLHAAHARQAYFTPRTIAQAWAAQLGMREEQHKLIARCIPVAGDFIRLLEQGG